MRTFKGSKMGRAKGGHNATKSEAARFASEIVESPEYRESLMRRVRSDRLPPAVETLLLHYRYGKPVDRKEHTYPEGVPNYADLSVTQLTERAEELHKQLLEARQMVEKLDEDDKFPTSYDGKVM